MIRAETETDWLLITHQHHALLAGQFAEAWGNVRFTRPEPSAPILYAVHHHDDGWIARDVAPSLTPAGRPEAFTRTLVGAYSAFEEIDLPAYLKVRGDATATVALDDPYAAILVSMHTCNLLTEQADIDSIRPEHREAHAGFLEDQIFWQQTTARRLGAIEAELQRGFEFLQCCDNLSLLVCSDYDQPRALRHLHPDRAGLPHSITCTRRAAGTFTLDPWPFQESWLRVNLPYRRVPKTATAVGLEVFRTAFSSAPLQTQVITLHPARD